MCVAQVNLYTAYTSKGHEADDAVFKLISTCRKKVVRLVSVSYDNQHQSETREVRGKHRNIHGSPRTEKRAATTTSLNSVRIHAL